MYQPSLETAKLLSKDYQIIPISYTIYADEVTPIEVLRRLKKKSNCCYLLESLEDSEHRGRYTFMGYNPKHQFTNDSIREKEPISFIRQLLKENQAPLLPDLPPFTGGLVGYFSYDFIKYIEPSLSLNHSCDNAIPDFDLMLFDKVIAFDHLKQKIILIAHAKTDHLDANYKSAQDELKDMAKLIQFEEKSESKPFQLKSPFQPRFNQTDYCNLIQRAKQYIHDGDIFQIVLSNRFQAEAEGSLLNAYRVLRTSNPSPYLFYFSKEDLEIAGASPETLVKLTGQKLYTFPLAGTRPRGKSEKEDLYLEKDLLCDKKELAEHDMLVDLSRNDLGKISKINSVTVESYHSIVKFSHVMHLSTTVTGELMEGKNALDAIHAVLPAGTLSGAPKIRACQIIDELEKEKRGIYGGAIGYIGFNGNLDTCIAIRLAVKTKGTVTVRAGAGIVYDSIAEKEYQECINKAQAVIQALQFSEGRADL
ncbi:anthranilate synthase component I [Sinanaerobacter sp. ZZT-01]|uniref:anthranilate synthase component I n=1 Tax=Sinanaerobacter sp. ZZT-01 TaxID=3111540 RepID=UPI002D79A9C2|nr:anthranilate synthase component I [Sinanaerobacter sp. ZZT-01]WRR94272.1 anthranilate synthase component I [Sinanaerobacter sp. ZZT-01]